MRVAIVGGGTLGRVLGVRLAHAGATVSFTVRTPLPERLIVERVDADERLELDAFVQSSELPDRADVVLVCLPAEAVDEATLERLGRMSAPLVVTFLPLLPKSWARISEALGDRGIAGIPAVTGYVRDDGVVRYWLPRTPSTRLDSDDALVELLETFQRAGLRAEVSRGVANENQVVTATLLPMAMALAAAGTIARALDDEALVTLALDAMNESAVLAQDLGTAPAWLSLLTKFIGPRMLKVGVGIAGHSAPESLHYVDVHFGKSRVASTRALADEALAICRERGIGTSSLTELRARMP